jgi:hypothetical protein
MSFRYHLVEVAASVPLTSPEWGGRQASGQTDHQAENKLFKQVKERSVIICLKVPSLPRTPSISQF